jgi:hypothetical protein
MTTPLDINLLAVARYAGKDYPDLLSLHIAEVPRRPARGRSSDRLILYFVMSGSAILPPGKRGQVLADLAELYYRTSGSVTSAMRAVAEDLNRLLLERNLRSASQGRQGMGVLAQVVLREQQLYLAQSGPVQGFLIASEKTEHFFDPDMADRSLGQGRATPIQYVQANLKPNDTLLLAAQPDPDWDVENLAGVYGQGPESLRRRLFSRSMVDLNAVLLQANPGKGKIYPARFATIASAATAAGTAAALDNAQAPVDVGAGTTAEADVVDGQPAGATAPVETDLQPVDSVVQEPYKPLPDLDSDGPSLSEQSLASNEVPSSAGKTRIGFAALWGLLIAVLSPLARALHWLLRGFRTFFGRILPDKPFTAIPSSVMAFVALAVPVVVVSVAGYFYYRLGRVTQYDVFYTKAQQMAIEASAQTDVNERRTSWSAVLVTLEQAEAYSDPADLAELEALKELATIELDELDFVRRVDYQPAVIGGLGEAVKVIRLVVSDSDLYMLDGNSGSVLRARPTARGFELDPSFQCGPDVIPGVTLSEPIMDMDAWPAGYEPEASILAIDSVGNLLFCGPDQPPLIEILKEPPSVVWENLVGFTLDLGDLYVLDPASNAVWIYWKSSFSDEPRLFFDTEIPFMQDVVDLAVNSDELYLLHEDGSLTLCYFSGLGVSPTRCSDPDYVDLRLEAENEPLEPPNPFTHVFFKPPPDPSLYLLEPVRHAVYHFSLRNLAFQRQYLPQESLSSDPATAFTIDGLKRNIFLAIDNKVFYGILP